MPTKVVGCDTPDGLAQLQYVLIKSGAALEIETVNRRPARRRGLGAHAPGTGRRRDVPGRRRRLRLQGRWGRGRLPSDARRASGTRCLSPDVAGEIATRLLDDASRVERLETTVAEISDQLQSTTTAKADFLANVSYELRTPVTVAKGIAYVLKNRGIPRGEGGPAHRPSRELPREALDADRGDADRRRPRSRNALARADAGRPRAAPAAGGGRVRASVPPGHDRTRDPAEPPRVGRSDAVHRDRPPAPRQRVPVFPQDQPILLKGLTMHEGVVVR
jgi:signal transduction histidine kinase